MSYLDDLLNNYRRILINGTLLPQRPAENWVSGVTGVDNPAKNQTDLTAAGSGGTLPPGTEEGDLLYWNGSAWVVLVPGTSGNILETQGSGSPPLWVAGSPPSALWSFPLGAQAMLAAPASLPAAASFTAVNALGATLTDDAPTKTLQLIVPGNRAAGGNSRGYFYKAPPATPYTYTAGMVPNLGSNGVPLCGIMIRDNSNKFITFSMYWDNSALQMHLEVSKWNSPTSTAGTYRDHVMPLGSYPMYFQLVDHGAGNNLDFSYSIDGKSPLLFTSQARNNFLGTIDGIGTCFDDITNATGTNVHATIFNFIAA